MISNEGGSRSYNFILKAIGIFSGVQIVGIIVSIIRTKIIATLLGTSGIGILGLFTATITLISSITSLGINFSAVRVIAQANKEKDISNLNSTIVTLKRWVLFSGILGMMITIVISLKLSYWVFGNNDYFLSFLFISIVILLQAITGGNLALLQGLQKLGLLAKTNIISSVLGLCLSIPLFYLFRLDGIVVSLVVTAFVSFIVSYVPTKSINNSITKIPFRNSYYAGINMVKLGSVIMVTNFTLLGIMYLIQIYINRHSGIEHVGVYLAANTIITGYIGLVFSSMLPELLPRLSIISDNNELNRSVNKQIEVAILLLGPILILLLSTAPIVITILYTPKFILAVKQIQWSIPGVIFMAANWVFGIMIIAKGNFRLFLMIELIVDILTLSTNIFFYQHFGIEGIGIAFFLNNLLKFFLQYKLVKSNYSFAFNKATVKIIISNILLSIITLTMVIWVGFPIAYYTGAIIFIISLIYTFVEFRERIDFSSISRRDNSKLT